MRLQSRFVVKMLAVSALPLALAACSPDFSDSATSDKAPKAKNLNAGLMTGTQLKKALAPASAFPSHLTPIADGASDSGGAFLSPNSPKTGKPDCAGTLETTGWLAVTGYRGGVSFAQNDYVNKGQTEEMTQEVDEFQGTTAKTVLKELQKAATTCATYTNDDHANMKVIGHATPGLGDETYTLTITSPLYENGTTLMATRVGTTVVSVMSTAGSDNGAASATKVATHIVNALKSSAAKS